VTAAVLATVASIAEGTQQAELRSSYIYIYTYASAGEFDELDRRAKVTTTTTATGFIYGDWIGDPIEGCVELQPIGMNRRSDIQWSRAVAPGRIP
jgi:hypothetical protein